LLGALTDIGLDPSRAEQVPGPFTNWLAELARAHRMWIAGCHYERDGDELWNTAYLLDRSGELAARYRKVHEAELYRREFGVRTGDEFPVFSTELGRLGMMICFDNLFPETSRALMLGGAQLIVFPDANFHPSEYDVTTLARARAIDNAVYVARSSYAVDVYRPGEWVGRSCVIGPDGITRADAGREPGIAVCEVDLHQGRSVFGYGTWGVNDARTRILAERRPEAYRALARPAE
jgi:predicted amidohydrolase